MVWEGWSGLWRCETKLAGVVEGLLKGCGEGSGELDLGGGGGGVGMDDLGGVVYRG